MRVEHARSRDIDRSVLTAVPTGAAMLTDFLTMADPQAGTADVCVYPATLHGIAAGLYTMRGLEASKGDRHEQVYCAAGAFFNGLAATGNLMADFGATPSVAAMVTLTGLAGLVVAGLVNHVSDITQ